MQVKDVGQILDLLIRDLYGHDPHLAIRELVQNAHDALVDLPDDVRDESGIWVSVRSMEDESFLEVFGQRRRHE
jgi:HSP90 family molecular chaperone